MLFTVDGVFSSKLSKSIRSLFRYDYRISKKTINLEKLKEFINFFKIDDKGEPSDKINYKLLLSIVGIFTGKGMPDLADVQKFINFFKIDDNGEQNDNYPINYKLLSSITEVFARKGIPDVEKLNLLNKIIIEVFDLFNKNSIDKQNIHLIIKKIFELIIFDEIKEELIINELNNAILKHKKFKTDISLFKDLYPQEIEVLRERMSIESIILYVCNKLELTPLSLFFVLKINKMNLKGLIGFLFKDNYSNDYFLLYEDKFGSDPDKRTSDDAIGSTNYDFTEELDFKMLLQELLKKYPQLDYHVKMLLEKLLEEGYLDDEEYEYIAAELKKIPGIIDIFQAFK